MIEISEFDLLKALIKDYQWANKVAELLGPEWDSDGRQLSNLIWDSLYKKYKKHGETAVELIDIFINNGEVSFCDNRKTIYDLEELANYIKSLPEYRNEF